MSIDEQLKGLAEMSRAKLSADQQASVRIHRSESEALVSVSFGFDHNVIFDVDVVKGEFYLWENDDDVDLGDDVDWQTPYRDADLIRSMPPDEFVTFEKDDDAWPLSQDRIQAARKLASELWSSLSKARDAAIGSGYVVVCARVGTPFAPFSALAPDQWAHLRIVDHKNGVAEAPTGERAYSIHLAPSGKNPPSDQRIDDSGEGEATAWLAGQLRNTPQGSKTKADFACEINGLWPEIGTGRTFGRIWKEATKDFLGWRSKGRRPDALKKRDAKTRH